MRKLTAICLLLLLAGCSSRERYIRIDGMAQGGSYCVKLGMGGVSMNALEIRDSVEALLFHIDTTLSGYNQSSLLSRFNRGECIRPNSLFVEMYREAYRWYVLSDGALDFAAGPLFDAWGFGFREGSMPSDEEVAAIRENCGMHLLPEELPLKADGSLDPADMGFPRLNYNAIAQGYSCDLVAAFLYRIGVKNMLVDIGEIWCDGVNPEGRPWAVGVDRPFDRPLDGSDVTGEELDGIWLSSGDGRGVVTSGNYRKYYFAPDGHKVSHTIDPRTGRPVSHSLLSATVVSSESACAADAYATWCMVVGEAAARELILSLGTLEGYLISSAPDGGMQEWPSPGFTLRQ